MNAKEARVILEDFLRSKAKLTATAYRQDFRDLSRFLKMTSAAAAVARILTLPFPQASEKALQWRSWLDHHRRLSPKTINRRLSTLRAISHMAHSFGAVPWMISVPPMRCLQMRDTRGPGEEAIGRMIDAAKSRRDRIGLRDAAIMATLFVLGLRNSELRALNMADFTAMPPTLRVLRKGWRENKVQPIPIRLADAIVDWTMTAGLKDGPLFPSASRATGRSVGPDARRLTRSGLYVIIRDYGRKVGVRATPHGFRHSATTVASGCAEFSVRDLSAFTAHASPATLAHYMDSPAENALNVSEHLSDVLAKRCGAPNNP